MNAASVPEIRIEPAAERDIPRILALVRKLAEYEKLLDQVAATEDDFRRALFGETPVAQALLAWAGGQAVGFALYFQTFSTFLGKPGVYLEDIFVEPEYRGRGIGAALLRRVAQIARERNAGRLEWSVLTWNQPAIGFYERLGAERMEGWRVYRLAGDPLDRLARGA